MFNFFSEKLHPPVWFSSFKLWLLLLFVCSTWSESKSQSDMHLKTCPCCRERWGQMEPRETEESQAWRSVRDPYLGVRSEDTKWHTHMSTELILGLFVIELYPVCPLFWIQEDEIRQYVRSEMNQHCGESFIQLVLLICNSVVLKLNFTWWSHNAWVTVSAKLCQELFEWSCRKRQQCHDS